MLKNVELYPSICTRRAGNVLDLDIKFVMNDFTDPKKLKIGPNVGVELDPLHF